MTRYRISFNLTGRDDAVRRVVRRMLDTAGFTQVHFDIQTDNADLVRVDMLPLGEVADVGNIEWGGAQVTTAAPGASFQCKSAGIMFRMTATDLDGFNTGRRRWRVECMTCASEQAEALVHEATTGPEQNVRYHIKDRHQGESE